MDVNKQASVSAAGTVSGEDLALINAMARRELTADEVYTFGVRLCDNEIDRDNERFDEETLEELGRLFVGAPGVFDHQWSAHGQTARIYRTELVRDGEATSDGRACCWLKGWAYMMRTEENAGLIAEIDGGIKREVSVGCAVREVRCSVCGGTLGSCGHEKGEVYGGQVCCGVLTGATDAYEWSFVAVPAQPMAGVVKGWAPKGGSLRQVLAWADRDGAWQKELDRLEQEAAAGRQYLSTLRKEVVRLGLLADFGLRGEQLRGLTEKLDAEALEEMKKSLEEKLGQGLGLSVQLRYARGTGQNGGDDGSFVI